MKNDSPPGNSLFRNDGITIFRGFYARSTIKFLSTDDQGYTIKMTIGNPKEGFTTIERRIPPMTVVSSTTRVKIDPQYERRNWIIGVDETPEQTERIRQLKAKIQREKNEVNLGLRDELGGQRAQRILTRLVEKIKTCRVVIPFPETLLEILDKEKLRVRGDYEKIMRMLEYYCILKQRTLPKKDRPDGGAVIFATPEAALEILRVAVEPLILMTLQLDKRTKKLLDEFRKVGITSAGATITPALREEMTRDLGIASNTLRIYLNELVGKRYLTDDDKRPKNYRLVESLSSIERKASALSTKIENADDFTTQMRREAMKTLEMLTAKTRDTDAETLTTLFNADTSATTRMIFAENSSVNETGQKQETTKDEPQYPDLRKSLRDQLELLCRTLHNIKENEKQGPIHHYALRERLGWDEDTFNRILELAKRERVVYEPRLGYLAVIR